MITIIKFIDTLKDAIKIEADLRQTIEASMLNHTIQLETTLNELHQEVRTDIFVDLQNEKTRLSNE